MTSSSALADRIRLAFEGVKLGAGVGLGEANGRDDYEPPEKLAALRRSDEEEDWSRISAEALNHCHASLSYFDAEAMRFHLPAFLLAELAGTFRFELVSSLIDPGEHRRTQFSLLSPDQRAAVAAFLDHAARAAEHIDDAPDITRALEDFWRA